MTEEYECGHDKSKLGDNYCVVCGVKFDKKFSAQDLLKKFISLDKEMSDFIVNIEVYQVACGASRLAGAEEVSGMYHRWKQENFGL